MGKSSKQRRWRLAKYPPALSLAALRAELDRLAAEGLLEAPEGS